MAENRRSATGKRVHSLQALREGEVGDWYIPDNGSWIEINIPTGPDSHMAVEWPFVEPNYNGARWDWNGDRNKPTLTPSLHWVGVWHGWMRDGELKSV